MTPKAITQAFTPITGRSWGRSRPITTDPKALVKRSRGRSRRYTFHDVSRGFLKEPVIVMCWSAL